MEVRYTLSAPLHTRMNHRSHLGGVLSTLLEQKAPKSLTPTRKVVQASTHANKHACTHGSNAGKRVTSSSSVDAVRLT